MKIFFIFFISGKERAFVDVAAGQKTRNVIDELS
jgi:hypothetical protein